MRKWFILENECKGDFSYRKSAAQRTLKSTHTRAQNRLNSMQNVVCVTPRDRPRALAARLWPPHAQPSCPGARRGPASHTARRGEASGGQSRPQTTVCRCGAPSLTEQRSRRGPDSASSEGGAGGRRAAEPAAQEGAWPRRAQARRRGQAPRSLGAARGGARPREHTQAVVSRRRSPLTTRMSGPEESPRDPDPPLGVERRWSLGGQHEHLPGADRASRRHVG